MNESTAAKRGDLRRQVLELRSAQRPLEVARKSQLICATLKQIPELQRARTIMAYAAIRQEADISEFWLRLRAEDKTVVLPRVKGKELEAVRFDGWDRTRPGPFGIREPEGEPFPPELIDAVLVPELYLIIRVTGWDTAKATMTDSFRIAGCCFLLRNRL